VAAGKTSMLKNKHLKDWSCIVSQTNASPVDTSSDWLSDLELRVVMTKSSSLTQVSHLIAQLNGEKPNTVRQRLKEWYKKPQLKKDFIVVIWM
jgi:elongation factor P hydroxylase